MVYKTADALSLGHEHAQKCSTRNSQYVPIQRAIAGTLSPVSRALSSAQPGGRMYGDAPGGAMADASGRVHPQSCAVRVWGIWAVWGKDESLETGTGLGLWLPWRRL